MSFLKGTLGMIGGGMGAMALLNEGKGETFTSYPKQNRLKQLMGKDSGDEFDRKVQEELNRAYKLYENGEMTNDEFKYIEASLEELIKNKESLISRNATFGFAPTTDEGVAKGQPRYKLMVMQDKLNPFTKDLPSGDTMGIEDFR